MSQTTQAAADLTTRLGPLTLRNPVLAASGTFGYGDEFADRIDLSHLGGVVTKTVTLAPRAGNPPHRIVETPAGMLNSIGLENVGLAAFRAKKLPRLAELPCAVIASLGGETPEELERLVDALEEESGLVGYEINFSCPNVKAGGARYWADAALLEKTCASLRARTRRSLWAKLSPNVTDPSEMARAAEAGGADAVTLVNTFVGTAVDLATRSFKLGRPSGGLSGPAIKPLALAQVHEVSGAVKIPVVGMGGIASVDDALEFLMVGASAVEVGTAHFLTPAAGVRIGEQLAARLRELGYASAKEIVGAVGRAQGGTDGE
ncbi:MAG TPA: dihydroorotate dehydrogenase [Candidatus Eisenbacteria bacterium]|nr:dihydroorotate dehydrogenase [Candidatus Eisenbacteria bacterium]